MEFYTVYLMLLTASLTAAYTINHDTIFLRDLTTNSHLQARYSDDIPIEIDRRGVRLSKSGGEAPQRTPGKPVLTPRPDKALQFLNTRQSGSRKAPPEIQNAERKNLPPSLGQGQNTRRPQTLQPLKQSSPSPPRTFAGGGTIGHSRIPPRVPKDRPGVERMQVPPSPAEEMRRKNDQSKTSESASTDEKKTDENRPKESKPWDPKEEGGYSTGGRPPALTSIDDF